MIDHVIVGHRIAISGDEEAGAFTGNHLVALQHALRHALRSRMPEEFLASANLE